MTTQTVPRSAHDSVAANRKKPYHHGDLRAVLVQATRDLVVEKGSAHFSVAQAARVAGVSSAAPYRHFKDREEMLDAVAADGLLRLAEAFDAAVAPHPRGSVDAVLAIGRAYISFAEREPSVFRLMFAEHQSKSDATCVAGENCKARLMTQVAAHIGAAEFDDQVMAMAFPLWAMVHGISFLVIDGKIGPDSIEVPVDTILRSATKRLMAGADEGGSLVCCPVEGHVPPV